VKELLLLVPFAMGWVVGWLQGSAKEKALAQELKWAKAKVQAQESQLARWSEKNSEWAKERVQEIRMGQPSALLKESGWDLPQVRE
jgi:hypothetical protein